MILQKQKKKKSKKPSKTKKQQKQPKTKQNKNKLHKTKKSPPPKAKKSKGSSPPPKNLTPILSDLKNEIRLKNWSSRSTSSLITSFLFKNSIHRIKLVLSVFLEKEHILREMENNIFWAKKGGHVPLLDT